MARPTRLIDANAFRIEIDTYPPFDKKTQDSNAMANLAKESLLVALNNTPTIDAEPLRHGKWELAEDGWYCSACKLYPPFDCDPEEKGIPYCPNCGADMRGEE